MQQFHPNPQNPSRCDRCDGMVVLTEDRGVSYLHCLICGQDRYTFPDLPAEIADVPGDDDAPTDNPADLDEGGEAPDPAGAEGLRPVGPWYPVTDVAQDRYRRYRETMIENKYSIEVAMDVFRLSRRTIYRILDGYMILDGGRPADCEVDEEGDSDRTEEDRPADPDLPVE